MNWDPLPVAPSRLGESPMWHPVTRQLYWCDIVAGELHRWDSAQAQHQSWSLGSEVACCAPVSDGTLLLALRSGIAHFDPVTGRTTQIVGAPYDASMERFNDGKVDPMGQFWVGTLYEPRHPPLARLHRLTSGPAGPQLQVLAEGITVSNGLAFSPDGQIAYRSDTTSHTLWRAELLDGGSRVGPWAVWARFPLRQPGQPLQAYGGRPDGAAVDSLGCYWVAMYEGQRLLRLDPSGQVLQKFALPVRCPTMPCFGGDDLKTLFLTSARQGRPADELLTQPLAGCVLQTRVEVPGLPLHCALVP